MDNISKGTLLIVDDETSIRSLLKEHLSKLNFDILTAENGEDALRKLEEHKVDIIISDIIMPCMDGVELVKRVRIEHPIVRIIMMTGYVNIENLLICVQNQVDTVIFKPFNSLDEFTISVEKSLEHLKHWQDKLKEYETFFGSGFSVDD